MNNYIIGRMEKKVIVGVGMLTDKKICYNCGKDNQLGNYLPNPSNKKHELIWCCDNCYEDWYIK